MAESGNPLDDLVDALVDRIDKAGEEMIDEQQPPFASQPLSRDEQVQRYREMRDDPAKWTALLDEQGLRATVEYAMAMGALMGEEGINASTNTQ